MGLDDLVDNVTEDREKTTSTAKTISSSDDGNAHAGGKTAPSTKCLPDTKKCPNCGEEGSLYDDVWKCEESWCGVDFFLTEKGHFCLPLDESCGFLPGYSV